MLGPLPPHLCIRCGASTSQMDCEHCGENSTLDDRYVLARSLGTAVWQLIELSTRTSFAGRRRQLPVSIGKESYGLWTANAEQLRTLRHRGLATFIEHHIIEDNERIQRWVITAFEDGQTLAEEMDQQRHTAADTLEIAQSIWQTLRFLHEQSPPIIGGAFGPRQIQRRLDGSLALLQVGDFDAVLAPFAPQPLIESDPYTLGELMVSLLSRLPPDALIDSTSGRLRFHQHVRSPHKLNDVVDGLLHPDPEVRFQSAAQLMQLVPNDMVERAATQHVVPVLELDPDVVSSPPPPTYESVPRQQAVQRRSASEAASTHWLLPATAGTTIGIVAVSTGLFVLALLLAL